jgi:acyl CoA:acetate/3-ketoacid CoA transferase beta subunit
MDERPYTKTELMICVAARLFQDGATAFIGTGIPMLAAMLASKTVAPNLVPVFEFGGTGAILENLPTAVGGARTFHKGLSASGICDVMETAQRGFIDYGFLGGAQIDCYGNLNSTTIGDHDHPKARLPGSGGGNDVSCTTSGVSSRKWISSRRRVTSPGPARVKQRVCREAANRSMWFRRSRSWTMTTGRAAPAGCGWPPLTPV